MSGQAAVRIGMLEFTIDSKDGLYIDNTVDEGELMTLQEAYELLEWLQDNLPERKHARSPVRQILDRPTTRGIDR